MTNNTKPDLAKNALKNPWQTTKTGTKPDLELSTPVQFLKGVGPRLAEILGKKDIKQVEDLIHWYPRLYRDQRAIQDFAQLQEGAYITFYGYVARKRVFPLRGGNNRKMYEMTIKTDSTWIVCKYFRLPYSGYFDHLEIDQKVKVTGKVSYYNNQPQLTHPDVHPWTGEEEQGSALIPVYTEVEKLNSNKIRKMIHTALEGLQQNPKNPLLDDPLPQWLKQKYQLMDRVKALWDVHHPAIEQVNDYTNFRAPAQTRLIFDEFFFTQLYMGQKKMGLKKERAVPIPACSTFSDKIRQSLPFSLTHAQSRVLKEIAQDLQKNHPMHRLIQGDVGCGKTIVALLSACPVIESGFQCAIMAPTEILAQQHYQNAVALLKPLDISVSLLTGKTRAKAKREIGEKLMSGYTSLCVGTHALIQETVQFQKPGLVIVDEQHRFGAHQRGLLKSKGGDNVHFLVMTATPIPRSLAMTLYGDLDVSVIDEMPKGRKPILTKRVWPNKKAEMWQFIAEQIKTGRQAYVVYPLVEESEHLDLQNAVAEYEKLQTQFPDFKIGLLHGRMSSAEKQEVMASFVKGDTQMLVSTTVIEVGVDVANAVVMVVQHAERFGLSQLHQLRGRVGRGADNSYCFLALASGVSAEAKERLFIMEQTNDGFKVASKDLEIRGPGEFIGRKQSGLPEFKLANLIRDSKILAQAKSASLDVIAKDPHLEQAEHQLLKTHTEELAKKYLPG